MKMTVNYLIIKYDFILHFNGYQNAFNNGDFNKAIDELQKCILVYSENVKNNY